MSGRLSLHCREAPDAVARELPLPATLKSQSLLAHLIVHGRHPQSRDHLAELFWGDRPDHNARRSLATALWQIRRCLPADDYLLTDAADVQFNLHSPFWLDAAEFEKLAQARPGSTSPPAPDLTALQQAVELYRGAFLDGFYDDWVLSERYRLESLFCEALAGLMAAREALGEHAASLAAALRLLEQDPLREDAHRAAMRAYCRLGQRRAALAQYARCQQTLEAELGAPPMAETAALRQAILDGRLRSVIRLFESAADMRAADSEEDQLVETKGYYAAGDGGGARYLIKTRADFGATPDEYGDHTIASTGNVAVLQVGNVVNVKQFGAKGDHATDDTTAVQAAYAFAIELGGRLYLSPGAYKGNFTFNGEAPVMGAGIKRTILMPFNESAACVLLYGDERDPLHSECNWGAALTDLSIVGPRQPWDTLIRDNHVGLKCGSDPGGGFSNGLVEHVEISAFDINWDLRSAVMCNFRQVFSHFGGIGLRIDYERNVTTCHFDTCRFIMNGDGMVLRGGYALVFTTCNSESNRHWGLDLRTGISSGPAKHIYNGCWFEENGWDGRGGAISLDMQPSRALTKSMDVEFNRCVISSRGNSVDVHADRAQNVVFRECAFTSDGFGSSKLTFARDETSAYGTVRIRLIQCGTLQERPTSAMYVDFPPLIATAADRSILPTAGYEYEFWENGRLHTNRYPYAFEGSPQGVLQPSYVGEEVLDDTHKVYYRSTGLTRDDWVALN